MLQITGISSKYWKYLIKSKQLNSIVTTDLYQHSLTTEKVIVERDCKGN